ncbi:serine/threonine protein kinase [bacterium]|nr:serine/threonine protein kinase [bacterium]MBP9807967.1 serine/threonine protein kinase [bacterium]
MTAGNFTIKKVEISGLNEESAAALWTQLATKARNAKIDSEVRDSLINWRYQSLCLSNHTAKISVISSTADNLAASSASTVVPAKPSNKVLILNFNEHERYSQMSVYLNACGKVALRCWTAFWLLAGIIGTISFLFSAEAFNLEQSVQDLVIHILFILTLPIYFIVSTAISQFANIYATILLAAMAIGLFVYLALNEQEPNTITFNDIGFVLLRRTSFSQTHLRATDWSKITAVKMVMPQSSSSKLRGAAIEIMTFDKETQASIRIPIGAFSSTVKRKHFLELLTNLNEAAEIDELVLETLSPRAEESYTSLWLNAIEAAPQLGQLLPLAPGSRLTHRNLLIEKQFATGGQAVTYLATLESESKVILKEFLLPLFIESARKKTIERFERDAKLLKNLDHPQIVKLHDFFIEDSRAFLMLEYIEGISLKEKIDKDGKRTEQEAINLALQMATILSYLHSSTPPVVHRDFTPENLILNAGGVLKLIDFDVALEADHLNEQHNAAGKTHYLPPEQFRGQPCPQSDIYAMGATLFFITTATDPEPMQRNRPQTVVPEISTSLDQFIATCTEPEVEKRYQTASELTATIEVLAKSRELN